MYNIAICDDNKADRLMLIEHIKRNSCDIEDIHIFEYESGESLLEDLDVKKFSLIFLDIEMEGIDGNETAKQIRLSNDLVVLVFITGHVAPSPDSFKVRPHRYLIKSMPSEELQEGIVAAIEQMIADAEIPSVLSTVKNRTIILDIQKIVYIEKHKRKNRIHLTPKALAQYNLNDKDLITTDMKLEDLYKKLEPHGYGYPHDSYIVNFKHMKTGDNSNFSMLNSKFKFTVSRNKAARFNRLKKHYFITNYSKGEKDAE